MKLLLDTHALLWWLSDDARLGAPAREFVADPANDILVSVVSLWEIQVKCRIGKLAADMPELLREIAGQGFGLLPIDPPHLLRLGSLPAHHRDPFDHLLIAQALVERATFVSDDRHAPLYDVPMVTCSG